MKTGGIVKTARYCNIIFILYLFLIHFSYTVFSNFLHVLYFHNNLLLYGMSDTIHYTKK